MALPNGDILLHCLSVFFSVFFVPVTNVVKLKLGRYGIVIYVTYYM